MTQISQMPPLPLPASSAIAPVVSSGFNYSVDFAASSGSNAVGFLQAGTGAVARTVQAKLREGRVSLSDYSPSVPTPTTPDGWYNDFTNPDGAGSWQLRQSVPNTVSMAGGAGVQGCGIIFSGDTSAATPNSGLAETNLIRGIFTVNSAAGQKVQPQLLNFQLFANHDVGSSGNEACIILGTSRANGPATGGSNVALGIWGGDFHVEKAAGVATGKMIGLEVGVHAGVTQTYGTTADRQNGIELWSGNRSGITAVQAHDALKIFGGAGWTNFLNFLHTDGSTQVCKLDRLGNITLTAPTGNIAAIIQTNQNSTTGTLQIVGRDSGGTNVTFTAQPQSGGQINIGAVSNHPLVVVQNNTEVWRIPSSSFLLKTSSGLESTGAGSAALGANCPASTLTAPYKWIKLQSSDGSTVYIPAWK